MRSLSRNKQTIYYALYQGEKEIRDEYGNRTGQKTTGYTEPEKFEINVSAARGTADVEQFGINANYNKTMVTNDLSCPIDEASRLWVGIEPTKPHNYVVISVARSINSVTYAIKEVTVS